jgi:hypothetical protein
MTEAERLYYHARWEHAFRLRNDDKLTYRVIGLRLGVTASRAEQLFYKGRRIGYPCDRCPVLIVGSGHRCDECGRNV